MRAVERQARLAVTAGARAAGWYPELRNSTRQREGAPVSARLAVMWLIVGLPLAWGVVSTLTNVLALFR
jgi:hypothetical protein